MRASSSRQHSSFIRSNSCIPYLPHNFKQFSVTHIRLPQGSCSRNAHLGRTDASQHCATLEFVSPESQDPKPMRTEFSSLPPVPLSIPKEAQFPLWRHTTKFFFVPEMPKGRINEDCDPLRNEGIDTDSVNADVVAEFNLCRSENIKHVKLRFRVATLDEPHSS